MGKDLGIIGSGLPVEELEPGEGLLSRFYLVSRDIRICESRELRISNNFFCSNAKSLRSLVFATTLAKVFLALALILAEAGVEMQLKLRVVSRDKSCPGRNVTYTRKPLEMT